ncbi:MAG: cytochrome c biogenesis protein CcsA [Bacteroidia bacterium]|nr:cytochrome c biogenesis protein CcsA [Bacteroidota bacterium]MBP9922287.1 cytochrome c biogenesis protein CcsA [Bacteroidia bacterium]
MDIQYIGEQLLWGKIGNLLVFTAFTAALLSAISYFFSLRTDDKSWRKLARQAFAIHTISITGIFALLFYLILNHRFEYVYVWEHSNTIMPLKYILSCFWEGQEGSFLLWMFWHCALGWVIIATAGEWENGVMFVISLVQIFLASMILGVVILGYKMGNNPFVLLRDHPDFANLPFIKMPDYLSKIKDGRGLNPLLQNYWMTIHPPTLFLGFASTVIPFAFAIAGLMRKKFTEWIKPAMPWTFFGVMILGTGILMGAAWAYESLSFGGFWAWDPVENASLVPWMTMVGLAHVMLIFKHRKRSILSNFILAIVTFFFILYSTFLTRSGILGNSSVHAFTDLGMSGHLIIYMFFFVALSAYLLIKNYKALKETHEEEHLSSREFWMFIGMLVLVIGCLQITFTTSLPVFNKLFSLNLAAPVDAIDHYNKWQVPVAIFICLLIGVGQYFKYKKTEWKEFRKKITLSLMLSLLVTGLSAFYLGEYRVHYYILFFASTFAVIANASYIFTVLKGKLGNSGASIAHIGIGLILMGALISNSKKEVISRNLKNVDLGKDMPNKENIMIEQKVDTLPMGNYYVTYSKRETQGVNVLFNIEYFQLNPQTGVKEKQFELKPFVQLNDRMGNVAEPATKHFLTKDIYTHITYAEIEKPQSRHTEDEHEEEYQPAKNQMLAIGDTFITSNSFVILRSLKKDLDRNDFQLNDSDLIVGADLMIQDINKKIYESLPVFVIKNFSIYTKSTSVDELGLKFEFSKIDPATGKIELSVSEKKSNKADFIVMKAIIFPGINILWIGCLLMIIGSVVAIRKRVIQNMNSGNSTEK